MIEELASPVSMADQFNTRGHQKAEDEEAYGRPVHSVFRADQLATQLAP